MAKADYGSPKYIAKQMKSRGLQRLRWYCQVCEKQCRDENGFKCHTQAPSHVAKVLEKGDRSHIEDYSSQFEKDFLYTLRLSHGTKPVAANRVYNEYIHNKTHIHMTATKWTSLAAFVRHLDGTGACAVSRVAGDGPPEYILALVDHSAEEQRVKQHQIREQRARASEAASQRVIEAQLRAAKEEATISNAEAAPPASSTPPQPQSEETSETPAPKISFSLAKKRR